MFVTPHHFHGGATTRRRFRFGEQCHPKATPRSLAFGIAASMALTALRLQDMDQSPWAGLGLLPAALLLLIARSMICTSGGYFFSINMRGYSAFSTAVTLTVVAALLLLIAGCVAKATRRDKYQPY